MAVDSLMHAAFRAAILDQPSPSTQEIVRSDGRKTNELRPITSSLDVLPCVHGSAYFSRGDTHVICSTTLGAYEDSREYMPLNGLGIGKRGFFMLHYDFPPYCTGELGSISQVSRRMIGHGNLAEKAVLPVMPSFEEFPYTVKVHSECTSSNGSSSMASACGSTLSLLSAGVPIKAPVAGVSVGLITEDSFAAYGQVEREQENTIHHGKYVLLKDILGSEDHHGDMDFKVAGTTTGITAIQLDVKLAGGVPLPLLFEGIDLAKVGRLEILDQMLSPVTVDTNPMDASPQVQALLTNKASQHSPAMVNLKPQSPRAELLKFDPDRKSQLIGPNGEMLKFIQDLYDVEVSIVVKDKWIHMQQDYLDKKRTSSTVSSLISSQLHDDEVGVVYIYGQNARYVHEARKLIEDIAVTVKEGDTLQGTIVDVRDYGAIVQINRGQQALLHLYDITYDNDLLKRPMEEILLKGHRLDLQVNPFLSLFHFVFLILSSLSLSLSLDYLCRSSNRYCQSIS
jgi:polyribonucleotide nucleotidyltransferase